METDWTAFVDLAVHRRILSAEARAQALAALKGKATAAEASLATGIPRDLAEDLLRVLTRQPGAAAQAPSTMIVPKEEREAAEKDVPPSPLPSDEPSGEIPSKLGRYRILGMLGSGGMGVVYRAFDPNLARVVALKTIRDPKSEAQKEWVTRFLREARAAAKLRHPGIVPVHDLGKVEGLYYFTMDLIDGKTFADAMKEGVLCGAPSATAHPKARADAPRKPDPERRLPLHVAVGVLADVAEALAFAHSQGIVHRDVKPQNILLDKSGRAYVTDFGLAKDETSLSHLTESGVRMGTAWYMSPEQVRGRSKEVTAASDVYSLGVILYQAITGRLPFVAETYFDLCEAIVRDEPRRPSEIDSDVPARLEGICLRAIEKSPKRRQPDADTLAKQLRRYLADPSAPIPETEAVHPVKGEQPRTAAPEANPARTPWAIGRVKRACLVGGASAILLLGSLLAVPWGKTDDPARPTIPAVSVPVEPEPSVESTFQDARDFEQNLPVRDSASIRSAIEKFELVRKRGAGSGHDAVAGVHLARLQEELDSLQAGEGERALAQARSIIERLGGEGIPRDCRLEYRSEVKPGSAESTALLLHLRGEVQAELHRRRELLRQLDAIALDLGKKAPKSKAFKDLVEEIGYVPRMFESESAALEKRETDKPLVDFLRSCKDPWWRSWGEQHGLLPPVSESAVLAALKWLTRHQNPDGSWKAATFSDQCTGSKCAHPGYNDYDTGVTGLSLLAFLGSGYTHLSREEVTDEVTGKTIKLGEVVKKAIRWLVNNQDDDGCIGPHVVKMMYNQSICAFALSEAYGMTESQILKEPAQKAIHYVVLAKNPHKAWRYTPKCGKDDSSVTVWCVMALKSAELSGLNVDHSAMVEARQWIDQVTDKNWGKVGYKFLEDAGMQVAEPGTNEEYVGHEALAAAGMVIRIFVDHDRKDPVLDRSAKLLAGDLPVWDQAKKTNDYYYWHYGTLALFQFDGPESGGSQKYWQAWEQAVINALVKNQKTKDTGCADGSWDGDDRWGFEGGRVYAVAINALTMEVYYRYANAFGVDGKKQPEGGSK